MQNLNTRSFRYPASSHHALLVSPFAGSREFYTLTVVIPGGDMVEIMLCPHQLTQLSENLDIVLFEHSRQKELKKKHQNNSLT
jgi:hypothetical protein